MVAVTEAIQAINGAALAGLDAADQEALLAMLHRVVANLENEASAEPPESA